MTGRISNETELIQTYLAPLAAGYSGAFGLHDDAALIASEPGFDLVVSTDPIIAGVHFFANDRAEDIAWKALAVNTSDLSAKGAAPLAYTMALAFPEAPEHSWMAAFAGGLKEAQAAFGCHLIGGDTDRTTGPLSISITAFGRVPKGQMVRRGTAGVGDHVFVTGTLGDAALGLEIHRDPSRFQSHLPASDLRFLVGRYLRPSPRVEMAAVLRGFASAALDVSDGLVKDAGRLAALAGARAEFQLSLLPLSAPARQLIAKDGGHMTALLGGGDDYEILFSVPEARIADFQKALKSVRIPIAEIGVIVAGQGVAVLNERGQPVEVGAGGYDHFK